MKARSKYMEDISLKICPKTSQEYFNENLRIHLFHNHCLGGLKLLSDFLSLPNLPFLRLLKWYVFCSINIFNAFYYFNNFLNFYYLN